MIRMTVSYVKHQRLSLASCKLLSKGSGFCSCSFLQKMIILRGCYFEILILPPIIMFLPTKKKFLGTCIFMATCMPEIINLLMRTIRYTKNWKVTNGECIIQD